MLLLRKAIDCYLIIFCKILYVVKNGFIKMRHLLPNAHWNYLRSLCKLGFFYHGAYTWFVLDFNSSRMYSAVLFCSISIDCKSHLNIPKFCPVRASFNTAVLKFTRVLFSWCEVNSMYSCRTSINVFASYSHIM